MILLAMAMLIKGVLVCASVGMSPVRISSLPSSLFCSDAIGSALSIKKRKNSGFCPGPKYPGTPPLIGGWYSTGSS